VSPQRIHLDKNRNREEQEEEEEEEEEQNNLQSQKVVFNMRWNKSLI